MSITLNPSNQWRLVFVGCRPEDTHVVPLADLREHDYSLKCWCGPTQDPEYVHLFVHHSLDRREEYEQGRPPS